MKVIDKIKKMNIIKIKRINKFKVPKYYPFLPEGYAQLS